MVPYLQKFKQAVDEALDCAQWSSASQKLEPGVAFRQIATVLRSKRERGKVMFIGNGGSAGIADHMAEDFTKAGGMRSVTFNNGALLTCLANDYSFEEVFYQAVKMYGDAGDVLVAISSSGKSPNILNGVKAAREQRCSIVTLSGFQADNPLRSMGDYNVYVPAAAYGTVEITHYLFLHALLDSIVTSET